MRQYTKDEVELEFQKKEYLKIEQIKGWFSREAARRRIATLTDQPQSVSYRQTITPDTYADDPIFHNIEHTLHNAYDENGSEIQLNNDESEGNE